MNTPRNTSSAIAIALALLCGAAQAGPGPQQTFAPVKSRAEAESLKPKTKIAITCPSCGAVTVSSVDKGKAHLHSFDCPVCKHSFEMDPVGSGKASAGRLVCRDSVTGKEMPLRICAEMHR
jgi:predicted RNA-binding Zn-ribbon protein involved in translation (DUF1610 family)